MKDDSILDLFGQNLRQARLDAGFLQAELAERAGLSQQYVSLIESGRQNITLITAAKLAEVVEKKLEHLVQIRMCAL